MENNTQTDFIYGQQPIINNTGIDMQALLEEWRMSKTYNEQYTRDFQTIDNLVDGIPINRNPKNPFVADTTLPGLVKAIPRNALQQLPVLSVRVNGSKLTIPALICTFLLKRFIFNEDTFGKGLLSTMWLGAETALAHGYAPFMVSIGSMFNDFGTTLRFLHHSDTSPEPGIQDHNETGYDFVVAHPTKTKIKRILRSAMNNPDTTWIPEALKKLLEIAPQPTNYSIWESAAKANNPGEQMGPTYELVTRYETGPDASIITFSPQMPDVPLRVMDSKSKWGYPRVMYLVIDPAALTPFGTSRVRIASPNANFMNIYTGNIAAMLLLNSKPPILKKGRFLKPVQLKQGAVWETLDQNASAELKTLDNGALEQYVGMQQQFAANIQNIMGGSMPTLAASSKSAYGNTGPGVKAAQKSEDTNTNQITKILENMLRQYGLVGLDTLLSEQSGDDYIIVDDDTKNQINQIKPGFIGDDNKFMMNWERFYEAIEDWSVEVQVSVSQDQIDQQKREDAQDMLTVISQTGNPNDPATAAKKAALENELMEDMVPDVAATTPSVSAQPPMMAGGATMQPAVAGQP